MLVILFLDRFHDLIRIIRVLDIIKPLIEMCSAASIKLAEEVTLLTFTYFTTFHYAFRLRYEQIF